MALEGHYLSLFLTVLEDGVVVLHNDEKELWDYESYWADGYSAGIFKMTASDTGTLSVSQLAAFDTGRHLLQWKELEEYEPGNTDISDVRGRDDSAGERDDGTGDESDAGSSVLSPTDEHVCTTMFVRDSARSFVHDDGDEQTWW